MKFILYMIIGMTLISCGKRSNEKTQSSKCDAEIVGVWNEYLTSSKSAKTLESHTGELTYNSKCEFQDDPEWKGEYEVYKLPLRPYSETWELDLQQDLTVLEYGVITAKYTQSPTDIHEAIGPFQYNYYVILFAGVRVLHIIWD